MLANWTKVLPFFVVEWLARRHVAPENVNGQRYLIVYGVFGPGGPHARKGDEFVMIEVSATERGDNHATNLV